MFANVGVYVVIGILLTTIIDTLPLRRYRRSSNPNAKQGLPYEGWSGGMSNPSGSIPGAYYGTGINPNYGHIGQDRPYSNGGAVRPIIYNDHFHNTNLNLNQHQQQQQLQHYLSNINDGLQQTSNNNYYRPYNRYAPGSPGWYAVGGNYWYNSGRSFVVHSWLLVMYILIVVMCK